MNQADLLLLFTALRIITTLAAPLPSESIISPDFQLDPAPSNDLTVLSANKQPGLQWENYLVGSLSSDDGTLSTGGGQGTINPSFNQYLAEPLPPPTPDVQQQLPPTPGKQEQLPRTPQVQDQLPPTSQVQDQLPPTPQVQDQLPPTPQVQDQLPPTPQVQDQLPSTAQMPDLGKPGLRDVRAAPALTPRAGHEFFCCSQGSTCEGMSDINTVVKKDGSTSTCAAAVFDCPKGLHEFIMKTCPVIKEAPRTPLAQWGCNVFGICL